MNLEASQPTPEQGLIEVVDLRQRTLGSGDWSYLESLEALAAFYCDADQRSAMELLIEQAVTLAESSLGPDGLGTGRVLSVLANQCRKLQGITTPQSQDLLESDLPDGHPGAALFERALRILEGELGADHPDVRDVREKYLASLLESQSFREAEPVLERLLATYRTELVVDQPRVAATLEQLANLKCLLKKPIEARGLLERGLGIYRALSSNSESAPGAIRTLQMLADLEAVQGSPERVEKRLRELLRWQEQSLAPEAPEILETLRRLGGLSREVGDLDSTLEFFSDLVERRHNAKMLDDEHWQQDVAMQPHALGARYQKRGHVPEAAESRLLRLLDLSAEFDDLETGRMLLALALQTRSL